MSLTERFLDRLDGVRRTGRDTWVARCPAHADRRPSLSIRDLGDRVLCHCFGGCNVADVVGAVGLDVGDLFERTVDHDGRHRERRSFPAADVLHCCAYEATVAALGAAAVADGRRITEVDRARLMLAASRLREGARLAGVIHGR